MEAILPHVIVQITRRFASEGLGLLVNFFCREKNNTRPNSPVDSIMDIFKRVYARNTTIEAGKPPTESPLDDDFQRTQDEFPLKYRRTLLAGPQFSGRTSVLFEVY